MNINNIELGIHPSIDRIKRGSEMFLKHCKAKGKGPYPNRYAAYLEKKLSDFLISRDDRMNPPETIEDGNNCVGGNCCWSRDNRCYHPSGSASRKCTLRY
jgi:hypothetical protein